MDMSPTIAALAKALALAQAEMKPAPRDAKNPYYKSDYATLASVTQVARVLHVHGIAWSQDAMTGTDGRLVITTTLFHESGEWLRGQVSLRPAKDDPQGTGSAISYGRRYGLAAIAGIVTGEDDDGNAASGKPAATPIGGLAAKSPQPSTTSTPPIETDPVKVFISAAKNADLDRAAVVALLDECGHQVATLETGKLDLAGVPADVLAPATEKIRQVLATKRAELAEVIGMRWREAGVPVIDQAALIVRAGGKPQPGSDGKPDLSALSVAVLEKLAAMLTGE